MSPIIPLQSDILVSELTDIALNSVVLEPTYTFTASRQNVTNNPVKVSKNIVEHSLRKGRVWDKRDRCLYCNADVTNFSRHLFRKHSGEESVKKIMELPKGNSKRIPMIDLLRKQGNYTITGENILRPVQRPTSNPGNQEDDALLESYLPCKYCKGYYKRAGLSRHAKKCFFNNENDKKRVNYASEGQTMTAFTASRQPFLQKLRLKSEVLDKMHADRIAYAGKADPVACQYAEDYLRKHKRPSIKNSVSNKVRELGRLIIALQENYGINSLLEAFKPEHFDKVVSASRIIAGYNEATLTFRAPSLALHMRTILLAASAAAKSLLLKKDLVLPVTDYEKVLKDVKRFSELVGSNWKFEMGSVALKDLNEKHSKKPQKLPITRDIILFKNYTQEVAEKCMKNLKDKSEDLQSFKQLTEAALALTILLNRKRVGDVQYTTLESYNSDTIGTNQEECFNVLSESEKVLSKLFKRIITIGKGSKAVPILFSTKIQEYIETLLLFRKKTKFVPDENQYLFALAGSSSRWVDGFAVLRKYAEKCGAENPNTLTSSRLRKQIATVLQILHLNDTEMEQVATFMGHTRKTHEEFYRLPQEVYQTAKIAKLLLMMERGTAVDHKGKTLDEIDVVLENWNEQLPNENEHDERSLDVPTAYVPEVAAVNVPEVARSNIVPDVTTDSESEEETRIKKKKKTASNIRGSWNAKQKSVMLKYFKKHVDKKISPKKHECLELKKLNPVLFQEKTWLQIKVFVYNIYRQK